MNAISLLLNLEDVLCSLDVGSKEALFDAIGHHVKSVHGIKAQMGGDGAGTP